MLIWLSMNVALPLLPLALCMLVSRMLGWQVGVVGLLSDGQLYFFCVALCAVFAFDALKQKAMDPTFFVAFVFAVLILMFFYAVSLFLKHGVAASVTATAGGVTTPVAPVQYLAYASIAATVTVVTLVCYARWSMGLL